jgi:hypothetical protein
MGWIAYVYDWQGRSYDPPECHPGKQAYTFLIRILSTSFISVSIFSVCCYSRVSISMAHSISLLIDPSTFLMHWVLNAKMHRWSTIVHCAKGSAWKNTPREYSFGVKPTLLGSIKKKFRVCNYVYKSLWIRQSGLMLSMQCTNVLNDRHF